jgi:uncharacterized oligopeptide transporter (OPT) family protein
MQVRELTLRGLVLGGLITTVFTAANVYLGLKVGLTFASSIPEHALSVEYFECPKSDEGDRLAKPSHALS